MICKDLTGTPAGEQGAQSLPNVETLLSVSAGMWGLCIQKHTLFIWPGHMYAHTRTIWWGQCQCALSDSEGIAQQIKALLRTSSHIQRSSNELWRRTEWETHISVFCSVDVDGRLNLSPYISVKFRGETVMWWVEDERCVHEGEAERDVYEFLKVQTLFPPALVHSTLFTRNCFSFSFKYAPKLD